MANSFAQSGEFTCSNCSQPIEAEVWLLVDVQERADLLARIRAGELHALRCPHCGQGGTVDVPLLVYTPAGMEGQAGARRIIFSPAQETTAEQDREHASGLLSTLAGSLGDAWQDGWLQEVATVPRPLLPVVLSADPAAALEELRQSDPDLWQALQDGQRDDQSKQKLLEVVRPLIQELDHLMNSVMQMPRRIEVCCQLLALLDRSSHLHLWALVQKEL